jgi:hypothetical protein
MATGSFAERYHPYRGRAEAIVYAGDQAPPDDAPPDDAPPDDAPPDDAPPDVRIDALELYGRRTGPCVEVPGVVEATQHATFNGPDGGTPWYVRGPSPRGRLGTLFSADHPIVKFKPELFTVLRLPLDYPSPEPDPPETPLAAYGQ